jgi:PAS domain-containing protein
MANPVIVVETRGSSHAGDGPVVGLAVRPLQQDCPVRRDEEPSDTGFLAPSRPGMRSAMAVFPPAVVSPEHGHLATLASLTTLAERWQDAADAHTIAAELADTVRAALDLDAVVVRIAGERDRGGACDLATADPAIDSAARQLLGGGFERADRIELRDPRDGGRFEVSRVPLGVDGRFGELVAWSRVAGFPSAEQALMLRAAASQASAALGQLRTQAAFDAARARWRMMLDGIGDAVVSVGADQRIEHFNAAAAALTGVPADEAIGFHV